MERYDYYEAMEQDIRDHLNETTERNYDTLYDDMFVSDCITGNGSGSYTFNRWRAEENLCHNMELLGEACSEFGCDTAEMLKQGAEACDVTIRCYILGQVLNDILVDCQQEEEEEETED